jgi:uncharacterized protein YdhG (YjbR/CyaY superfamily)
MTYTHQEFMANFDDERKQLVAALLAAITEACPTLTENIKWNAPNFSYNGKDRLTFMLHKKDRVSLILHTGVKPKEDKKAPHLIADDTGLLEWNSNIRATITFFDLNDFLFKRDLFKKAVEQWIEATKEL